MPEVLDTITLGDVVKWIIGATVAVSGFLQFSNVNVNPWTWVAKKIGKAICSDVINEVEGVKKDVKGVSDEVQSVKKDVENVRAAMDEKAARDARTRILRFGDEILHGTRHSKEHFDEIMLDITEYNDYCESHPKFKNQMAESTIKIIVTQYEKCLREHSFLEAGTNGKDEGKDN